MIDDKKAIDALNKVDKKGKTTGQKFADVAKKGALIGAAVVTGTVAAGGALLGMASKTAEATDRVDKLSQKIGMSREGFQEWDFIMSQSGGSVEQLQVGFKKMVTAVDQAAEGTGAGAEAFDRLGISVKDSSGNMKSQEDIFNESVVALQGMEAGTEKASLANDLFGKSGSEMMPLLNGAAGSVEEMKEKAHELGLVLDDETIDAGVAFTDTMDQVKRGMTAVVTKIGSEVMPIIKQALDWVISNMPQIQAVMSTVFAVISEVVGTTVGAISDVVNWFITLKNEIADSTAWNSLKEVIQPVIDKFMEMKESMGESQFLSDLKTALDELKNKILEIDFVKLKDDIQAFIDKWLPLIAGIGAAATAYGLYSIALGIKTAIETVAIISMYAMTAATTALNGALAILTSPIVLVIAAIAAVIAIGVLLWQNWDVINVKAGEFGATVANKFNELKDKATNSIQTMKDAVVSKFNELKTTAVASVVGLKDGAVNKFNEMKSSVVSKITELKSNTIAKFNEMKTGAIEKFQALKTGVTEKASGVISSVKEKFSQVYEAIMSPVNKAKNAVSTAVDKMKGFFDFNWKLPSIKMPKFSVSGSKNPMDWIKDGVPKLSVNWNAKGGVFNSPTLFPTAGGYQGVGEAGAEAVLPLNDKTYGGIGKGIADSLNRMAGKGKEMVVNQYISSPKALDERESQRLSYLHLRDLAYKL